MTDGLSASPDLVQWRVWWTRDGDGKLSSSRHCAKQPMWGQAVWGQPSGAKPH
jgi:hypothetical protein